MTLLTFKPILFYMFSVGERESINVGTALKRLEEQYEHRKMVMN